MKYETKNNTRNDNSDSVLPVRTTIAYSSYIRRGKSMLAKTLQTIARIMAVGIIPVIVLFSTRIPVAWAATDFFEYTWGGASEYGFQAGSGDISIAGATYFLPEEDKLLCGVTIPLKKIGTPTGNMIFSLRYSGGTPENGTLLYTATLNITTLTTAFTDWNITINNGYGCENLLTGNTYYFTVTTTQAYDVTATNYVVGKSVAYNNSALYPNVAGYYKGKVSGWSAGSSLTTLIIEPAGYDGGSGGVLFPSSTLSFANVATSTVTCNDGGGLFSSSTISNLGCHFNQALQNAGAFLFYPASSSIGMSTFNNALQSFQNVFPFNIFFNFAGILNTLSSEYETSDNTITLSLPTSTIMKVNSYTFSSTTLSTFLGPAVWTTIREFQVAGIWLITLFGILTTTGAFNHGKQKKK